MGQALLNRSFTPVNSLFPRIFASPKSAYFWCLEAKSSSVQRPKVLLKTKKPLIERFFCL
jgi:hypothetical protein